MGKSFACSRNGWQGTRRLIIALCGVLVIASTWVSAAASDGPARWGTLSGDHQKQQFLAGERVEVSKAKVADDVFAAGRSVRFNSSSAKRIVAAGGSIFLAETNADDVILVGGELSLSGIISDDVIAAGEHVDLTSTLRVGDDARLAGRDVTVGGRIGGDLYAAAQYFKLAGEIAGNARIEAERIVLAPGARIGGDLRYVSRTEPVVSEGAMVAGQMLALEVPHRSGDSHAGHWIWYGMSIVLGLLLSVLALGAAMQLVMPGLMSGAASHIVNEPWVSLGRGIAIALLVPAAIILLLVIVVGIPVALVSMAAYTLLLAAAFVAVSYCVGLWLRRWFSKSETPFGLAARIFWTLAGVCVVTVVALVPLLGWALTALAMVAGLGAVVSQLGSTLRGAGSGETAA